MMKRIWIFLLALCMPLMAMAETITIGKQKISSDAVNVVITNPRITVQKLLNGLSQLEKMESLTLEACEYEPAQLIKIRSAFPDVEFCASFRWRNQRFDTAASEAVLKGGKLNLRMVRQFLDVMTGLQKLDIQDVRFSLQSMQELLRDYPQIDFLWKVPISGQQRVRIDVTAFSTLNGSNSERLTDEYLSECLVYMPNLLALDLGHNSIDDVGFLKLYPELKVLILADNRLGTEDVQTIAECCPELEYLELFMNDITDLSALTKLKKLKHLNICRNEIEDVSPLLEMSQLERCWISRNRFPKEQREWLIERMPGTVFEFDVDSSTDGGWRKGSAEYAVIYEMFHSYTYIPFAQEP